MRSVCLMFAATLAAFAAEPTNIGDLKRVFQNPPDDARIMMRWWWFGPAVKKDELEREMRAMKEGGIGGFEVQPVYPLELEGNSRWLAPDFLDALRFVGEKARELGLRMDLTLGSGWPYGGPHIEITQASPKLRVDRVNIPAGARSIPLPKIVPGEKLIAAFLGTTQLIEIDKGMLTLPSDLEGATSVQFFISSRTRQMVKRPSVGAEGYVLDHYNRAAIATHLRTAADPMMEALRSNPPYSVFSDSLEVYNSDWAGDFLEQFRQRRGYDLLPYLPALSGDMGPNTAAIRRDWGKTLTELCEERYLTSLREWAKKNGTRFRSQTYGIPPMSLSSNALVDLPEGEGSHWRQFTATRWASSASHLYGRPVTSSETWTWLHSPAFRATPLDMKAEADLHFLQGVNQLIGHGWPYSPPEAGEPGYRFYAAAVFNTHNPWWTVMPDVTRYLQRVSFMLRQGRPANDVAVYLPTDDAYAGFTLGRVSINPSMDALIGPKIIPGILDAGYNFDFIDDGAIARAGVHYSVLILPGVERMPLTTLRKIQEYTNKGGVVIATRRAPSMAPGLSEESDTAKIRTLAASLRVVEESQLGAELNKALRPDVATAPEIGFVHRKLDFADVYFLANTSNRPVHHRATFRIEGMEGASWDPFTGAFTKAANIVDLDLAPYESRILVFSKDRLPESPVRSSPGSIELSKDWKVTFPNHSVAMSSLRSWTEDDATRYFSGLATYEKSLVMPAEFNGHAVFLSFGEGTPVPVGSERRSGSGMRAWLESPVHEAAKVFVNGTVAGSVWRPPYEIEIGGLLHPGDNTLRIEVANLAINQLARGPLPDYKALNAKYGERFQPQDMLDIQPVPSGLLGPIRLIAK